MANRLIFNQNIEALKIILKINIFNKRKVDPVCLQVILMSFSFDQNPMDFM